MPSASTSAKKFFLNRRFYLHIKTEADSRKAAELIRIFGGQIDEFLESSVSYVLTDVPKNEWPPVGGHDILKQARRRNIKLMSLHDLKLWCEGYMLSHSSSDEDEDSKVQVIQLREPFIKFEDLRGNYAPVAREIPNWPMFNQTCPNGRALFQESGPLTYGGGYLRPATGTGPTPNQSAQLTPQMVGSRNLLVTPTVCSANMNSSIATPLASSNLMNGQVPITQILTSIDTPGRLNQTPKNLSNQVLNTPVNTTTNNIVTPTNNLQPRGVKRRHMVYCEICNLRLSGKLEDHIQSQPHKTNVSKLNWNEVHSVLQSLPAFSSLSKLRKGPGESVRISDQHEFLCLHKVESVSQLFMNTASKEFHSLSPHVDRQLVQIQ